MKLKIESFYGKNKYRKAVTFDIPQEVADYFIGEFQRRRATGECSAEVTGCGMMRVGIAILHEEGVF